MVVNLLFCWCGRRVVFGAMPPYSVSKVVTLGSIGHVVKGGHVNLSGVNIVVSKMVKHVFVNDRKWMLTPLGQWASMFSPFELNYAIPITKWWCCVKPNKRGPVSALLGPHQHALAMV